MNALQLTSKEGVFDFLDSYARQRKEEIHRHELGEDQGLIKSYLIETLPGDEDASLDLQAVLSGTGWRVTPIDSSDLHRVQDSHGILGFLEPLSSRHLAIHSTEKTYRADKAVRDAVRDTSQLDSAWLAGSTFQIIWEQIILPQMPDRSVKFKFEHQARFEDVSWDEHDERDEGFDEDWDDGGPVERRASISAITERVAQVGRFLPQLQAYHPPFKAIKMLRIPTVEAPGGYDFWWWGKITYRAPTFRDGRYQARTITDLYERTTRAIEKRLWFQAEKSSLPVGSERITLTGAPVTLVFDPPLPLSTFQNLVTTTFERGQGPLRLWGNPIRAGENRVHVYGIDLHLWKRIYLEITPRQMTVVLPYGTCGNTVHRLVTNIQRFLDPTVQAFIGDVLYGDLVRDVFLGRLEA